MSADHSAIETLAAAWAGAWNAHDAGGLARLVEPDVDFVTVAGVWLRGVEEFRLQHDEIHRLQMRDSIWTNVGLEHRKLRDDLFLVHLQWAIEGDRDPDGTPRAPRHGIFTWLVERHASELRIVAGHNTNSRNGTIRRPHECPKIA